MARGRPTKSQIRQNIVEMMFYLGKAYGYQVAKLYNEIFPEACQRSIYYHLKKGISTREIEEEEIVEEVGNYSWGTRVEKVYYKLGKEAQVKGSTRVKEYFHRNKFKNKK